MATKRKYKMNGPQKGTIGKKKPAKKATNTNKGTIGKKGRLG